MEIAVEYDDDTERRRIHLLLMPKVEPTSLLWDDTEVLKKVEIIVPGEVSRREQSGVRVGRFRLSKS